ncbi:DUF6276 family protein [Halorussus lipolyticus]|uniref:DUF6276 family protein n=1 Tax=Halorussus lipolyticus TaxID=3034024 RepID=UPI0023E7FC5F|nr:DUF6276 family protein [Halorussus sp. DT80]
MPCPECTSEQVAFRVPAELQEYLPEETETAAICTVCLALVLGDASVAESPPESPDFDRISDAFPGGDAGVAMALAVGLLDSLALYRSELAGLLERVERAGTDPLLVLDRLDADPELEPHFDVDRRRTQAEQLLYG